MVETQIYVNSPASTKNISISKGKRKVADTDFAGNCNSNPVIKTATEVFKDTSNMHIGKNIPFVSKLRMVYIEKFWLSS